MTEEQTGVLVLKDTAGSYFLIARETLERGRVPTEHKAEVERLVAEAAQSGAGGDDVGGYLLAFVIGVGIGYFGTKAIIDDSREEQGKTVGEYLAEMRGIGRGAGAQ